MKNLCYLLLVIFILNGCKTLNEKEILGKKPDCINKICDKMEVKHHNKEKTDTSAMYNYYDVYGITDKTNSQTLVTSKNYLLDIGYTVYPEPNLTTFTTGMSLGLLPLIGFPDYVERSVELEATLKTKLGTPIKTYRANGPIKGNVAAILYGYSLDDAAMASTLASYKEAMLSLYQQLNTDEKVYSEAENIRKKEEKEIKKLKNIINGHRFIHTQGIGSILQISSSLKNGDVIYLASAQLGYQKVGLFAGQNVIGEGNLADFEYPYGIDKVFLYGKYNYTDGQPLKGYYKYNGNYTYPTVLGATKTVPAFQEIDIPEELIKYIDIVNKY